MANLKKHFVFKVGGSTAGTSSAGNHHGVSTPSSELLPPGFSKSAFMNEVSSLLDQCGLYVSAMNGFCTSGCSLAKCLVKVFHAVPLYRETASTLLTNWEEIAQTTAAASASVKTETLMQLQDVLTRLETSAEKKDDELAESVHAVSSCLMAYIELQAQFSYSVFKALGKLSRQQQNGFSRTSRAEETVRKQFSQIINRLTGPSAKTPSSPPTSQATTPIQQTPSQTAVWPAEIHLAPSGVELDAQPDCEFPDNDLDDVINLLSIGDGCDELRESYSRRYRSTAGSLPPSTPLPPPPKLPRGLYDRRSSKIATPSLGPPTAPPAPPKIPPRPDAFSQDAFRIKQQQNYRQQQSHQLASHQHSKQPIEGPVIGADAQIDDKKPSWSPWGPDWSTEELNNWPSHSSDTSDYEAGWIRWQATSAKEKTQTWPRPLRDPSAPWEWQHETDDSEEHTDDGEDDTLDAWKATNRESGRVMRHCTWPLKVAAEAAWHEPGNPWRKDDPLPPARPTPWDSGSESSKEFQLFNQR